MYGGQPEEVVFLEGNGKKIGMSLKDRDNAVYVKNVIPNSMAYGKVSINDRIVMVGDHRVTSEEKGVVMEWIIEEKLKDVPIKLTVERGDPNNPPTNPNYNLPNNPTDQFGYVTKDVTTRGKLGLKLEGDPRNVKVVTVAEDGNAFKAGIQKDDLIVGVGANGINDLKGVGAVGMSAMIADEKWKTGSDSFALTVWRPELDSHGHARSGSNPFDQVDIAKYRASGDYRPFSGLTANFSA